MTRTNSSTTDPKCSCSCRCVTRTSQMLFLRGALCARMDAPVPAGPLVKLQPQDAEFRDPRNFINRELSSLAFTERVLDQATDPSVPLFERLRFLGILGTSLDEFFMIRVAGLKQQLSGNVEESGADALSPAEQLNAISQRCHAIAERQERVLLDDVFPAPWRRPARSCCAPANCRQSHAWRSPITSSARCYPCSLHSRSTLGTPSHI